MVCAAVTLVHQKIILAICYRPPSSPTFVHELHDAISVISTRFPSSPLLLLGDFNFPNISWNTQPPCLCPFSANANEFLDLCSLFSLSQLVTHATRLSSKTANTLDLVLTNRPDFISTISYLPGISDHSLLNFSIDLPLPRSINRLKIIRDYNKANFEAINGELSSFISVFLIDFDNRTVQANWDLFLAKVYQLIEKFIPNRTITTNTQAPWYNNYIKRLSNKKKRAYRSAKLSPTDDRWSRYKAASNTYVNALKNAKDNFLSNTLPTMLKTNAKQFWRVVNPAIDDSITLLDDAGDPFPKNVCASVLNDAFTNNFSTTTDVLLPSIPFYNYATMSPITVDVLGTGKLINSLNLHSSPGFDCINSKFLKNTCEFSTIILTKIFQQSIDSSVLPVEWKIGKVVPIYKTGIKTSPLNYRPISLTSTCCKMLEHVIYSNLVNFLESNSFFTPAQHGFRKSYSCETQLISFTHALHRILDCSSYADCIFLDFAKAFDKVCHQLLLHKLNQLSIDYNVLKWIEYFLANRSQFVYANGYNSSLTDVCSGVPQGTVLGPLLFLIYINDLPSLIKSNIYLFADDCVVVREITNINDSSILQSDLNTIATWCNTWLMKLNINKCKIMRVTRATNTQTSYYLNNSPLQLVNSYKYLGVHITSNLTWSLHIQNITNNANRMLGYLRRNFSKAPSSLKLLLYKTLIRSKLEYATSVWDPYHEKLINLLELVQNNSVRFILSKYDRAASITDMKSGLDIPSLSLRRKVFRLSLFHNLYHHPTLRDHLIPYPQYVSNRIDHCHKVGIESSGTQAFNQSFILRTAREWNHLPAELVNINDNQLFRAALANFVYLGSL